MTKTTDHLGRPVAGIGIVTSLGVGKADNWDALTSGRPASIRITRFPVDHLNTTIAGTVDFLSSSSKGRQRADL
jgi:3-oxoacyl-[acyl-carrier-protein] synthase II